MQKVFERPNATIYASIVEDDILNLFILDKTSFINRNFIAKTFSNFTVMKKGFIDFLKEFAKSMEEGKAHVSRYNLKVDAFGNTDILGLNTLDGNMITMFHVSTNREKEVTNTEVQLLKLSLFSLIANLENLVENKTEPQFDNFS